MTRLAALPFVCLLVIINAPANAQAGAVPPTEAYKETAQPAVLGGPQGAGTELTTSDICRTLEEAAAENGLPVDFFVRVIWQESRFNAHAVSRKGAVGIAQFMPRTADWRGLLDPFDTMASLKASASYLRDLRNRFGNFGLAAAAYNAGPRRVQDWLVGTGPMPAQTRDYVQAITGRDIENWRLPSADLSLSTAATCPALVAQLKLGTTRFVGR